MSTPVPPIDPNVAASDGNPVQARLRPDRWFTWVWIVPVGAAALVAWLAWRSLADRGPEISISFRGADGLEARQSTVQHRGVVVGTVESLDLTADMSHVIVHARMTRAATGALNEHARFYIVAPRVSAEGISGLSTLVSGSFVEMVPGPSGTAQRHFNGLDEPPVLQSDTPGRTFILLANDLGSLTRGAPVSYRGVAVGEVEGFALAEDGQTVKVSTFIREPYDRFVHNETRFWNAGGVDVSLDARGVRIRANSWQQLLSGGIAFETAAEAPAGALSPGGATFYLYDNRATALRDPRGEPLIYLADFTGNLRGVGDGTPVELQGNAVGKVTGSQLKYDARRHTLVTHLTLGIDPDKVQILGMAQSAGANPRMLAERKLAVLVEDGLRAQVSSASLVTGLKIIALDIVPNAPHVRMGRSGDYAMIPSVASGDLSEVLQSLRGVLKNIDRATAGPELGHAVKSLDATLTQLDRITHEMEPDIKDLIKSLRDTADSAQKALSSVQGLAGSSESGGSDLPRLMRELTEAARSVRGLADYLERHPESLLRGRKGNEP